MATFIHKNDFMGRKLLCFALILTFLGCGYKNKKVLFKGEEQIKKTKEEPVLVVNPQVYDLKHRCQNGDQVLVKLLNEDGESSAYDKLISAREDLRFMVHDSVLTLPVIGDVKVVGLTKSELLSKITEEYKKYVVDPIIDIEFTSLAVNVLGEVENPGYYLIKEGMTLIDALGLAGGIAPYGIYKNVKIIRGQGDTQEVIIVDISNIRCA